MVFASGDAELVLAGKRATLVKVNVVAPTSPAIKPSGIVRVDDAGGALLGELPLSAPSGSLPSTAPTRPSFADSYSATIPAELVRAGMRVSALFTPSASNALTVTPRVGGSVALRVVTVPVQIGSTVGQVVADSDAYLRARLPAGPGHAGRPRADGVGAGDHAAHHVRRVEHGVQPHPRRGRRPAPARERVVAHAVLRLHSQTNSGLAGMGYRPGNAAVGLRPAHQPGAVRETMVHEIGHNLSLRHAPCGDPSSPDPNYPYANAAMGAGNRFIWGYDAAANRFIDPTPSSVHDVMSYCSGDWFSDYNYRLMQVFLTPSDRTLEATSSARRPAAAGTDEQELLVVSGDIDAQAACTWIRSRPRPARRGRARNGPYLLRITRECGAVIEQPFAEPRARPRAVTASASVSRWRIRGAIDRAQIVHGGRVVSAARVAGAGPGERPSAPSSVQASEQGRTLQLQWDAGPPSVPDGDPRWAPAHRDRARPARRPGHAADRRAAAWRAL